MLWYITVQDFSNLLQLRSGIRIIEIKSEKEVEAVLASVLHQIQNRLEALRVYRSGRKVLLPQYPTYRRDTCVKVIMTCKIVVVYVCRRDMQKYEQEVKRGTKNK